ncbi:hypothetical protein HGRIS_010117 [Hohenbuehelia grisea]|uniref:GATA-type domain-containing protein n=1 Tax=Hohenbuehelia grisea TaxID=104357 RepID=A0ABR3J3A0_9AGAR
MDFSLQLDLYSDASSTPRTPSPNYNIPFQHIAQKDMSDCDPHRGSLLQELYSEQDHDLYLDQHQWQQQQQHQQQQLYQQQPQQIHRRATFPYVRQDRDDMPFNHYQLPFIQPNMYPDSVLPLSADPFMHDNNPVKLEDPHLIVPSQSPHQLPPYFTHPQAQSPIALSYLNPHSGMPVQHTDDAASKETQYLRRRCFNCHTTEPPSWRRSTLNPGKIVCNKCGLYERTHLRPRPLRFDELRAGNKTRKQSNASQTKGAVSPKAKLASVKKEPREFGITRRSSVSSSASSTSGASDWDDSISAYSAGSAPPTSFNSPNVPSFPLSRESLSPPHDTLLGASAIRLPNAPLSDIASLQQQQQLMDQALLEQHSPVPSPPMSAALLTPGSPVPMGGAYYSPPPPAPRRASVSSVHSAGAEAELVSS